MGACCSAPSQRGSLVLGTASVKRIAVEHHVAAAPVPARVVSTAEDFQEHKAQLLAAMQQEQTELVSLSESGNDRPNMRAPWRLPKTRIREAGKIRPWYANGGLALQPLLQCTTLLDVRWLVELAKGLVCPELNGVLPAWQQLPPDAAVTLDSLLAYTGYGLPIIVLSYPWASKDHADPTGRHLASLLPLLEVFVRDCDACGGAHASCGVLWDWASFPQRGQTAARADGVEDRSPLERARFQLGLEHINVWYSAPYTFSVLLDTPLHESAPNQVPYDRRGWTCFERRISCLVKAKRCLLSIRSLQEAVKAGLDLSQLVSTVDLADRAMEYARNIRPVPMLPERFEELVRCEALEGRLAFTNGHDLTDVIIPQYRTCFMAALGEVSKLVFVKCEWSDDDACELARALKYAHEHGALRKLKQLYLSGNTFGDQGLAAMRQLFEQGVLDGLRFVDMKGSCGSASEEAVQALQAAAASRHLARPNAKGKIALRLS